ncbi:MAG: amidohydrolase family protein, partial [Candidatus Latescibacteria bacterium]|nr:amidohydrolase family protein [Candidatus Latescibacterota bacterium]
MERRRVILRGATLLTLDPRHRVVEGDLRIDPSGRIDALLSRGRTGRPGEEEHDLAGRIVLPGLVQSHVHLCQTLFRGMAERRSLFDWLRDRIWPLEAAHDPRTIRASVRLGILELLTGGTTAVLDMGTTRHLDAILETCEEMGIRARSGNAIMDEGEGVPESLVRPASESLAETEGLLRRYPAAPESRVGVCVAPRFVPTVSNAAWDGLARFARERNLVIHTHACETTDEVAFTAEKTGRKTFAYLRDIGAASPRLVAAHGVRVDDAELGILAESAAGIVHCPGSNAKLGSGTADVVRFRRAGVPVGIGTDAAACNNRLCGFEELRRAAHAASALHGPEAVDPASVLDLAGRAGARLLGLEERIGSLEPGKEADLVVLDPRLGAGLWSGGGDPHAAVLYGAG